MITPDDLAIKMRADYGDDELDYLAEHYPNQFAHIAKVSLYFLAQHEQELLRNKSNESTSGLQPEAGSQGQSVG
jgi:hypothetical protein